MSIFAEFQPRMTKADLVYAELRRQLISGERPPGQSFSTYDLAREFGVSRRPVMDAVTRLENDGFIEIVGQVGCRVIVPTTEDILNHMDVTTCLGGAAGQLAAERATDEQIAEIERVCDELEVATVNDDDDAFDALNIDFHNAITDATGNRRLSALVKQAWDITQFFRYMRDRSELRMLQDEHIAAVAAIKARDGRRAREILEIHHSHAKDRVVERHNALALESVGASDEKSAGQKVAPPASQRE